MRPQLRVVFDVNVWATALLGPKTDYPYLPTVPPTGSNSSADCLSLAFDGDRFTVYISPHIIRNLSRVLAASGLSAELVRRAIEDVVEIVHFSQGSVVEPGRVAVSQKDFEDNLILDLMLETGAEVLVTRDSELLANTGWKGRAIVHPASFVQLALSIRPS